MWDTPKLRPRNNNSNSSNKRNIVHVIYQILIKINQFFYGILISKNQNYFYVDLIYPYPSSSITSDHNHFQACEAVDPVTLVTICTDA